MNIIVLMEIFREESQEELGFKYSTYIECFRGFCIVTPLYNFSIKKCHTGLSDV